MPTLTVITLTRNRLERLDRMLALLMPQLEAGDEIVLIDTGSTDGTRERFRAAAPDCVRFFELDKPGSWAEARNFGVIQARGDLIAFTDDDCMPAADWVARGKAGLGNADAVGGMVRAHGIKAYPKWWHPNMAWMVGLSVPGQAGADAGRVHYPATANVWARAAACRAVPFQEIGGTLEGGGTAQYLGGREDAQWWRALRTGGWRTRFDPELAVGHAIDAERLNLDYLEGRAVGDGLAWAGREGVAEDYRSAAYGWWDHFARQMAQPLMATAGAFAERRCEWHWHRLGRLRQGAALRGLAEKGGAAGWKGAPGWRRRFWSAGVRYGADHGRTILRAAIHPWLISKPERANDWPIERLAVVAFGFLGDLMILQSALRGLTKQYPQMTVHVAGPASAKIALRGVQRVVVTPAPGERLAGDNNPEAAADWLASWLRDVRADAIIAPYLHGKWGLELAAVRNPPRPVAGFDGDCGLMHRRHLERLAVRVHKNLEHHELKNLLQLLKSAGLECAPLPSVLEVDPAAMARARANPFLAATAFGGPVVMFNPDAGQAQKEWTEAKWEELARRTLDATPWRIVFNASRPRPELERRIEMLSPGGRVHWLREAPLEDLIAWLSLCQAIATVDAGPQHLAHALAVPSVTLYGPMDERRWRDHWKRPMHRTIRACTFDLTPEERQGLEKNHMTALIEAEGVFRVLEQILLGAG